MKSKTSEKAQISLEYILILAMAFSLLAAFLVLASDFAHKAELSLEKQKAKHFHNLLEDSAAELQLFGNGSSKAIMLQNRFPWEVSLASGKLSVKILFDTFESESITFDIAENMLSMPPEFICKKCQLLLKKSEGIIFAEFSDIP